MNSDVKPNEKYVKLFSWRENPFNFKILPELFVGYMKETEKITNSIQESDKLSLLIGPTGSGKTTLMKHLNKNFGKSRKTLYVSKPPKDPDDWVKIFTNFIGFSIFERLFSRDRNVNLYNLSEWVNKKTRNKKPLLLVDESHEASVETLEWLRTLVDQIDNLTVVIAGLPVLEPMLKENIETFTRRINRRVELANLTKSETRELVKRRIEWAGGEDIKPFTSDSIEQIYRKTGGFPRDVIRVCSELVQRATNDNITTIDVNFLKDSDVSSPKRVSLTAVNVLPSRQRHILEILGNHGEMSPAEIVDQMDLGSYKSRDNAIRSINNILKRLVKEGHINRNKEGKSYRYLLSDKTKTLMVNA